MKKTAVIYWSGTGNTKQMAEAVLEGMKSAGADAVLLEAAQVDASTFSGVYPMFVRRNRHSFQSFRRWQIRHASLLRGEQ